MIKSMEGKEKAFWNYSPERFAYCLMNKLVYRGQIYLRTNSQTVSGLVFSRPISLEDFWTSHLEASYCGASPIVPIVLAFPLVENTNEKATAASVLMSIFFALIIFVFITLIFLIVKLNVSCLVAQMLFVLIDDAKIWRFSGIRKNNADFCLRLWRHQPLSATNRQQSGVDVSQNPLVMT